MSRGHEFVELMGIAPMSIIENSKSSTSLAFLKLQIVDVKKRQNHPKSLSEVFH